MQSSALKLAAGHKGHSGMPETKSTVAMFLLVVGDNLELTVQAGLTPGRWAKRQWEVQWGVQLPAVSPVQELVNKVHCVVLQASLLNSVNVQRRIPSLN